MRFSVSYAPERSTWRTRAASSKAQNGFLSSATRVTDAQVPPSSSPAPQASPATTRSTPYSRKCSDCRSSRRIRLWPPPRRRPYWLRRGVRRIVEVGTPLVSPGRQCGAVHLRALQDDALRGRRKGTRLRRQRPGEGDAPSSGHREAPTRRGAAWVRAGVNPALRGCGRRDGWLRGALR
jgi:hypothetical protein